MTSLPPPGFPGCATSWVNTVVKQSARRLVKRGNRRYSASRTMRRSSSDSKRQNAATGGSLCTVVTYPLFSRMVLKTAFPLGLI